MDRHGLFVGHCMFVHCGCWENIWQLIYQAFLSISKIPHELPFGVLKMCGPENDTLDMPTLPPRCLWDYPKVLPGMSMIGSNHSKVYQYCVTRHPILQSLTLFWIIIIMLLFLNFKWVYNQNFSIIIDIGIIIKKWIVLLIKWYCIKHGALWIVKTTTCSP